MSLLGRNSTIDVALQDVRRGLADAEAFMEICRFEFKHARPAPASTTLGLLLDRPNFLDDFAARPTGESTIARNRRPPADDMSGSQGEMATSVRDAAPPKSARDTAPAASKRATAASPPAVEAADTVDRPVEELPPVIDPPPQDDEPDWPEMPDFLDRRN